MVEVDKISKIVNDFIPAIEKKINFSDKVYTLNYLYCHNLITRKELKLEFKKLGYSIKDE